MTPGGRCPTCRSSPLEETLRHFGQDANVQHVRTVLGAEQRRFSELLARGRKVLSRRPSDRPLSEAELSYLHETHGLPPELVVGLLSPRS